MISLYSDRIILENIERYKELSQKHFGDESQWFDGRSIYDIQAFLRELKNDDQLVLCAMSRMQDAAFGNPVWCFACAFAGEEIFCRPDKNGTPVKVGDMLRVHERYDDYLVIVDEVLPAIHGNAFSVTAVGEAPSGVLSSMKVTKVEVDCYDFN